MHVSISTINLIKLSLTVEVYALFTNNYCTCFSKFIIGDGDAATRVVAPRKSLLITVFFFRLAAEVVLEILGSLV